MKARHDNALKKIAITATVSGEAGRAYLSGAFSYISENRKDWTIEVFDSSELVNDQLARPDGPDGAIIMTPHAHLTLDTIQKSGVPAVIVDFAPPQFQTIRHAHLLRPTG